MEKYARVLIIIFFLCLFNLGLNIYVLSKLDNPVTQATPISNQLVTRNSPQAVPTVFATTVPSIQSNLTQIKAEIRALRDSLESTGLILQTPEP
ncbi:MAG: hypothetical protein AAB778_02815 [Patescibacteria group bacterium]